MTEQELFIASDNALTRVVDQIRDDQWDLKVPPSISNKDVTLKEIINYHAYDEAWVPDVLDGKTASEVGSKFDGDLLGADPKASWRRITDIAIGAVRNFKDSDKIVHLSYGDYKAREYLLHISSFRAFRSVDIARFIGADETMSPDLVQSLWDYLEPHIEEWRKMGIFGPAVEVDSSESMQAKLLGLVGRTPHK